MSFCSATCEGHMNHSRENSPGTHPRNTSVSTQQERKDQKEKKRDPRIANGGSAPTERYTSQCSSLWKTEVPYPRHGTANAFHVAGDGLVSGLLLNSSISTCQLLGKRGRDAFCTPFSETPNINSARGGEESHQVYFKPDYATFSHAVWTRGSSLLAQHAGV